MNFIRSPFILLIAATTLSLGSIAAPLKIGVTPGSLADSIAVAAAEARQAGQDVEVIEFTDWTTPNTALDAGDLDLNYFQHQAFLDNAIRERGYKLESIGLGLLPNIGLYSKRHASLDALPERASIGVASDPVNQGRGLLLLQHAGLIKLRDGAGARASVADISDNPRQFKIVEVEGPQLVRALDDLDLAQGYPSHLVNAGQAELARHALQYSSIDDVYYAIAFVARSDRAQDSRLQEFVQRYQSSAAVRKQIHDSFAQDIKLYSLPWQSSANTPEQRP